ncbi:MAG: phage major capsid protein [Clostridia bacterium]|nr:phage major capsid protein [Clostridia bacterium]
MTYKQYHEKREALLNEAQALINEGKLEEAKAKQAEVTALDNEYQNIVTERANLNALAGAPVAEPIENKSVNVSGARTVDVVSEPAENEAEVYLHAWAADMQGRSMTAQEKSVFDKVNAEFNNAYTHDTTNTAVLIPETVAAGIWKRAEEMYPLYADARKYNVRGKLVIKKHTGIVAGDAAWYDEQTPTADEQNAFGELILDGRELSKAVTVTWKLRAMAMEEFIPFIINELGERMGVALGNAAAKGKGAASLEPEGVETALLAEDGTPQIVTYTGELGYATITEAVAKIHSSYLAGAAIYANNSTVWGKLANIMDGNKRPLFVPDVNGGGVGRIFGMVVKPDAGVSDGAILVGNAFQGLTFNVNEPLSITTEEHAKARTTDYVAYAVVDGGVVDTKAFAMIRDTAEA